MHFLLEVYESPVSCCGQWGRHVGSWRAAMISREVACHVGAGIIFVNLETAATIGGGSLGRDADDIYNHTSANQQPHVCIWF